MRILMVMDDPFPPDLRVEREALALAGAGHAVSIVTFRSDHVQETVSNHKGIEVITLPLGRFWYKMSALAYTLPLYHWHLARRLGRRLGDRSFDVLHIHDLRVARAAMRARPDGCKVVLDLHENRPEIMRFYKHVRSWKGRLTIFPKLWARFERRYIRASDATIVVTREAEAWYRERGIAPREGFWIVPNYAGRDFNPDPQPRSAPSGPVRMLYIGDTGERRGLGIALQAMRDMGTGMVVELDVLGDGTYQGEIERMVRDWGLEDRVRLHGWVAPSTFDAHLSRADVGICPIQRNPHHDTTYANKIFQYMAYGLPILVSDCPSQVAVVKAHGCGAVHMADSPKDFTAALQNILSDQKRYEAMSRAGVEATRQERNWEVVAEQLVSQYASLASA